jgi:hypothetical protein
MTVTCRERGAAGVLQRGADEAKDGLQTQHVKIHNRHHLGCSWALCARPSSSFSGEMEVERRVWGTNPDRCPDSAKPRYVGHRDENARPSTASTLSLTETKPEIANTTKVIKMAQSDDEDDYMNMVFEDAPKAPRYESATQRAVRKRKEVCASA